MATSDQPGTLSENGYRVITLTDCTAATSAEEHDNAIAYDYPMLSLPMESAAVADALK